MTTTRMIAVSESLVYFIVHEEDDEKMFSLFSFGKFVSLVFLYALHWSPVNTNSIVCSIYSHAFLEECSTLKGRQNVENNRHVNANKTSFDR